ncbi:MAG: B12-binding domain-containing radical SAM protein, partial [Candidatus Odinarchaeia archaeon]
MRILLAIPPLNFRSNFEELRNEYSCDGSLPPLGLMYIYSVLDKHGFDVKLLDLAAVPTTKEAFRRIISKMNPDIVGFSIIADSVNTALVLAKITKEELPNTLVIGGGISPTFLYKEILAASPHFDIIVRGEGEYAMLKIAELVEKGVLSKNIKSVDNIVYRNKAGKPVLNGTITINKDLDALPFPDRQAVGFDYNYQFGNVQFSSKKFTTILTSRGCPFRCRFCACSAFSRSHYRERSVENVLNEFELIYSQGYRQILITDDHFFVNPKRTSKILEGLRKRHIDMDIICESRVDYAKKDLLKKARKSSVQAIFYGMESGSQRVLDYYNKKITISQIKDAVRKSRDAGITMLVGSFMYGAPGETLDDMLQTTKLILSLDLDVCILNIVDVLPGTELWFEAERRGILPSDAWRNTVHASDIFPDTVPEYKIKYLIDKTY